MDNVIRFLIPGCVLLLLFGLLNIRKVSQLLIDKKWYWLIFILVLIIQLGSIWFIRQEVGDVKQFGKAGYFFRFGSDFYTIDQDHSQYPFFPFLIFFHAAVNAAATSAQILPFTGYLKLLLLAALYLISFWLKYKRSRVAQLQFLTSPVTYAVVIYHGQIDVLLLAFLIGALEFLSRWRTNWWGMGMAGILYGASIATKTWSVIFAPLILKFFGLKTAIVTGTVAGLFLVLDVWIYTRSVFGAKIMDILTAVTKPGGPVGIWGISYFLQPWTEMLARYNLGLFAGLMVIGFLIIWKRKQDLWKSSLLLILWVYLVIPNWGVQYLFWVLPFLYVSKNIRLQVSYTLLAGLYCWLNYLNVAFDGVLVPLVLVHNVGLGVWLMILYWFFRYRELSA